MHHITNLVRNLAAGLRLAVFLPVSRLAFRIDLAQLLLLLVVSAVIDIGADWARFSADGYFSWFGLGNEFFGAGVLLVTAALLALAFGQSVLVLAVPVIVLAAFPLLQIVRVVPELAGNHLPRSETFGLAFDGLMIAWVVAMTIRAVGVALAGSGGGLWWRALVGGVALSAPIWFSSAIAPNDSWWITVGADNAADPRYPNPASEPVIAAQQKLLDDALSNLEDERPGATDLYFVGFAGDAREDVFRKDVQAAQKVMDERWGTDGRSIALINNPRTLLEAPEATITNLRETLNEIGATIDAEEDVVMVYLASHGSRNHVLEVSLPPLELAPLTAPVLRGLLDAAGIKWRIVVISACYSGGFIEALKDDYTLVLTASDTDRASFGCGNESDSTYFGEALFQHGLAHADSILEAFDAAKARVGEREKSAGLKPPSNPQIYVGPAMAEKIKELDRGNAALRSGRTV
jgi:hypothetical protein